MSTQSQQENIDLFHEIGVLYIENLVQRRVLEQLVNEVGNIRKELGDVQRNQLGAGRGPGRDHSDVDQSVQLDDEEDAELGDVDGGQPDLSDAGGRTYDDSGLDENERRIHRVPEGGSPIQKQNMVRDHRGRYQSHSRDQGIEAPEQP